MSLLWQRMKQELRNPRKSGALLALLAVALLLWGRLLLERVPRIASADPAKAQALAVPGGGPAGPWLEPGPAPEPTGPLVEVTDRLPRDLFALRRDQFEMGKDARTRQATEKSPPQATDEVSRRPAVLEAARALRLESIVWGPQPRAMINGRVLGVEQQIHGFTLVRVAERFVLLERDGEIVRLDL